MSNSAEQRPRHTFTRETGNVVLFERSEFLLDTSKKKNPSVCVCVRLRVRLILVLVWDTRLILVLVWGTYYVPYTYVPGISRQKSHHVRSIAR